ncbi:MAG: hypothetical protein KGL93_06825 [Gemmatimonadota bacterium]|nr:hypothetical protein [Gemmatimonadota bacterium]HEU4990108.1 hypothetical protein [Gemmatimonadaceae bacterium]
MRRVLARNAAWLALLLIPAAARAQGGPFDIALFNTPQSPSATGQARLVFAPGVMDVAVTADGRARYDARVTIAGLPAPRTLGPYTAYVAWAVTPDLTQWHRLGAVHNGVSMVGTADFNKFLLVITAEASAAPEAHHGPVVLHGTSPSGWLQNFTTHPLFRGVY